MTKTNRNKPVDICFVLDATSSMQSVFISMVNQVNDLRFELEIHNRRASFRYGSVIYRDPVDYVEITETMDLTSEQQQKLQEELDEIEKQEKDRRIKKLQDAGLYDEELEAEKEEIAKHYDRFTYPINQNVAIPFKENIECLIQELMRVECNGGNDDPEDWVGALELALNDLEWREKSKKCIIWIADSNAHGKRYCGYDNHNEEEPKLQPLVERMAKERFYFVGINVIKDKYNGCQKTLQEIREIYQNAGGVSFIIDEFKPIFDQDLLGDDNWPADVLNDFMQTITKTMTKLGSVFDD